LLALADEVIELEARAFIALLGGAAAMAARGARAAAGGAGDRISWCPRAKGRESINSGVPERPDWRWLIAKGGTL